MTYRGQELTGWSFVFVVKLALSLGKRWNGVHFWLASRFNV